MVQPRVSMPPWAVGVALFTIPAATYAWMLWTRPNIYEQIAEEIKRQEELEKARTAGLKN